VSIGWMDIELWSKATGRWVYRRGRRHGLEEVLCVVCCQKSVDVEVPKRAISQVHEKIFSAMYIQGMPCAVQQVDGGENVL